MNHPRNTTMGSTSPPWKEVLINFLPRASMWKGSATLLAVGLCSVLSCSDPVAPAVGVAVKPGLVPDSPSHTINFTEKFSFIQKTIDCDQCGEIWTKTVGALGPSYYQTRSVTKLFAVYNYGPAQSNEYECSNFFDHYCVAYWDVIIPCNVYRVNMSEVTVHVLQGYTDSGKGNSYDSYDCGAEPNPSNPGGDPATTFQIGGSSDSCPAENRYSAWLHWSDGSHPDVFLGYVCIYTQ